MKQQVLEVFDREAAFLEFFNDLDEPWRAGAAFALSAKRSMSNDQEHDLSLV